MLLSGSRAVVLVLVSCQQHPMRWLRYLAGMPAESVAKSDRRNGCLLWTSCV